VLSGRYSYSIRSTHACVFYRWSVRTWVLCTNYSPVSSLPCHISQFFVCPCKLLGVVPRQVIGPLNLAQQPSVRGKVGHQEQEGRTNLWYVIERYALRRNVRACRMVQAFLSPSHRPSQTTASEYCALLRATEGFQDFRLYSHPSSLLQDARIDVIVLTPVRTTPFQDVRFVDISNVNHVNSFDAAHELVRKDVSYNLYTVTCSMNGLVHRISQLG
jgi:hypothetical protein